MAPERSQHGTVCIDIREGKTDLMRRCSKMKPETHAAVNFTHLSSFYIFPDLRHGKPDTDFRESRHRLEVFQQSPQRTWKLPTLILREGKGSIICNYSESPIRRLFCERKDGYQGQLLLWQGTGNTAKPLARMAALVLWELLQPLRRQPTPGALSCTLRAEEKRAQASWQPSFHHVMDFSRLSSRWGGEPVLKTRSRLGMSAMFRS